MDKDFIKDEIVKVLKTIFDPEIPVDIWELGLIYFIDVADNADVKIRMTLTSPNCPVAESLPQEVKDKVEAINQVKKVTIDLTFDPPWDKDMMSEEAQLILDLF